MEVKKLAKFLLLMMALDLLLFSSTEGWRRRRRRRHCSSSRPYSVDWANNWHQHFVYECSTGKEIDYFEDVTTRSRP